MTRLLKLIRVNSCFLSDLLFPNVNKSTFVGEEWIGGKWMEVDATMLKIARKRSIKRKQLKEAVSIFLTNDHAHVPLIYHA